MATPPSLQAYQVQPHVEMLPKDQESLHRPCGRQGFGAALLSPSPSHPAPAPALYVFGGRLADQSRTRVYSNDLWRFSLTEQTWRRIAPSKEDPPVRHNTSLTLHQVSPSSPSTLLLFGGAVEGRDNASYSAGLFAFDVATERWREIKPKDSGSPWPTGRQGHCAVALSPTLLCVFAGRDSMHPPNYQNDIWLFDLATEEWQQVTVQGEKPDGRYFSSMVALDSNRLLIFGGFQWFNQQEIYLNDCWTFTFSSLSSPTGTWSRLALSGNVPGARNRCSLNLLGPDRILLFGGNYLIEGRDKFLADAYLIDPSTGKSLLIDVKAEKKAKQLARGHHYLVLHEGDLWMFGGERHRVRINDIWRFPGVLSTLGLKD